MRNLIKRHTASFHANLLFKVPAGVTTTVARSQVVSFTMPLVWVKFTLFIKNPDGAINYEAYTEPLHYTTWLLIFMFCIVLPPFLLVSTQ